MRVLLSLLSWTAHALGRRHLGFAPPQCHLISWMICGYIVESEQQLTAIARPHGDIRVHEKEKNDSVLLATKCCHPVVTRELYRPM
jgi:hypothetical protein